METMTATQPRPTNLPFLQALGWQGGDMRRLADEDMLARYERGWRYLGVLAELDAEERDFVRDLAQRHGSWLTPHV